MVTIIIEKAGRSIYGHTTYKMKAYRLIDTIEKQTEDITATFKGCGTYYKKKNEVRLQDIDKAWIAKQGRYFPEEIYWIIND